MNDPDRRQTSDGFDHDAMFADIVAHWNDAASEPLPVQKPPSGQDLVGDAGVVESSETTETTEAAEDLTVHDLAADEVATGQPPAARHDTAPDLPLDLPSPSQPQAIPAPQAWRAQNVDDDFEEHFEPPPTAPLPVGDLQFWGIIAGMCGGPLLLLYLVLFNRDAGSYWMLTAIAMSVGGFALLVSRLPRNHGDDDDGARL